ncbi:hypothetical protein Taro_019992 [Colocasia esculenta]|uniref:Uncharacterized protein n=1 Tax=Colocasia esculenta TaxID=4460 RepID=A0A843UMG0_COLES|nr:hypothetical protein [Colocasia esculenta]
MAPRLFSCFGRGAGSSSSGPNASTDASTADLSAEEQRRGAPVVVELFSSQGCATSPQAELLLSRLGRGDFHAAEGEGSGDGGAGEGSGELPPVVVLAFHVDYWDHVGWKDPYASSMWTVRQKAYVESLRLDALYTPQVVVQGRAQVVGTDEGEIISAVRAAARFPSPTFQVNFQKPSPETLRVTLSGHLRTKVDSNGADVQVALYENGLITDCTKGENGGKVLSNDFVVRKLEKLCHVKDISAKKTLSGSVNFPLWEGFNSTKCGIVVFVQNNLQQIFGAQHFELPDAL